VDVTDAGEPAWLIIHARRSPRSRQALARGERQHSPQVSARITPELQNELRKYSKRTGLSHSQVLRHALEQLVGSRPSASTPSKKRTPATGKRHAIGKDPAGRS
jgi:Ribbon-helix-helix domain